VVLPRPKELNQDWQLHGILPTKMTKKKNMCQLCGEQHHEIEYKLIVSINLQHRR
jgi:hypothetical protein